MTNLLESFIGKEMDIQCGTSTFRGTVRKVLGGMLLIEKDELLCYINTEKIIALWDSQERKNKAPGFTVDHSAVP